MAHASGRGGKNAALLANAVMDVLKPGPAGKSAFIHLASIECPGSYNTMPDKAVVSGQLLYGEAEDDVLPDRIKALAEKFGGDCVIERDCEIWHVPESNPIIKYAEDAAAKAGLRCYLEKTGAGSDAHVISKRGGKVIKISTGMQSLHSADEFIDLEDMKKCFDFLWALAGQD
jgi:tripeptide aminopeptidase